MAGVIEATEMATEAAVDAMEAIPEVVTELVYAKRFLGYGFAAGLLVGGIGAYIGYRILEKKLRLKYQELAESEIEEMRAVFRERAVAEKNKPALEDLKVELDSTIKNTQYGGRAGEPVTMNRTIPPPKPPADAAEAERRNAFQEELAEAIKETGKDPNEGWDYEIEVSKRDAVTPFIIHQDERGEPNFTETRFTYYEVDDVLADERDGIVENRDEIIGQEPLHRFGHGADDENVVNVRNVQLEIDVEITRVPVSYAEDVAGIAHSEGRRRAR